MLQNAANQRSLAFLDQKIAIMYNYKALLVIYTFNEKLQLNKLNKKTTTNLSLSLIYFRVLLFRVIEITISIYLIYTVNTYGNSI